MALQKVFSSLHKIQTEPLTADGLPGDAFHILLNLDSGIHLALGSRLDSQKSPSFYLKYLKLCSVDTSLELERLAGKRIKTTF